MKRNELLSNMSVDVVHGKRAEIFWEVLMDAAEYGDTDTVKQLLSVILDNFTAAGIIQIPMVLEEDPSTGKLIQKGRGWE